MPRPSYEEHRARKRRGSLIESETDAESMASFTTHQSTTSSYQPYAYASSTSRLTVTRHRTLSSTSFSPSPSPRIDHRSTSPAQHVRLGGVDDATVARREARRKRREEQEKKSTLYGERYDSPLRRLVRWCAKNEEKERYRVVIVLLSGVIRIALAMLRQEQDIERVRQMLLWLASRTTRLRHLARLSDHSIHLSALGFQLIADTLLWAHVAGKWTRKEAKTAGRSWRSQAIAFGTLLFAPCFLLPAGGFSTSLWAFSAVTSSVDETLDSTITSSTNQIYLLMLVDTSLVLWLPVIALCVCIMNLVRARRSIKTWSVSSLWSLSLALTRCADPIITPVTIATGFRRYAQISVSYRHMLPAYELAGLDCPGGGPNVWCASDVMLHWRQWMSPRIFAVVAPLITAFTLLPSLAIVCYATYAAGPGIPGKPSPSAQLLPTALFTSSLSILLFSPSSKPADLIAALLPLSLMTSIRGGKDELGEDEGWEYGTLVQNTMVFLSLPVWTRQGLATPAMLLTLLWNWLIGYSPLKSPSSAVRTNVIAVYAGMILVCILERVYPSPTVYPAIWNVLRCLISFAVLETAWIWGLTRLYLQTWGLVGLGSSKID